MSRKFVLVTAFLAVPLLLAACGGGTTPPTCSGGSLVAPNLTSPSIGSLFDPPTGTFHWNYPDPSCNPEEYDIEVNEASDFSGTGYGGSVDHEYGPWDIPMPLNPGAQYFWRVRAHSQGVDGPWSSVWWFYTGPACDGSSLIAPDAQWPAEGAAIYTDTPMYQWDYPDPSCSPEGYHLQVSSSPDFSTMATDIRDTNPNLIWTPGVQLADCTTYYWRVAAIHGGTDGPFSDPISFVVNNGGNCVFPTCPESDLVAPIPISPGQNENVGEDITIAVTPPGILQWHYPDACSPESYIVHLSPRFDMSDTALFGTTGSSDMEWNPPVPLLPGTRYWWEIIPTVGGTQGPASVKRNFFTGPECDWYGQLTQPELLNPAEGEYVDTVTPILQYALMQPACIPDGYVIDLQTDENFAGTNLAGTFNMPGTLYIPDPLQDCTIYYWRVRGIDASTHGPWSQPSWFFTNEAGNCAISQMPQFHAEALQDLICRLGPNGAIAGYFLTGETAPIVAQSLAGEHWIIENPDGIDWCYVPKAGTDAPLAANYVRRFEDPESDREPSQSPDKPVVCNPSSKTQEDCEAGGGTWFPGAPEGKCKCP